MIRMSHGQLHHIGLGRTLDRTPITMLITGYNIRIIQTASGEIIRSVSSIPNTTDTADTTSKNPAIHPEKHNIPSPDRGSE